ncbi:MAG: methyltransferase domain-containing protein [Chloroflexi bacterium]|nr:methyltransferase domain-containing protein [Chloroflexota bacterium]
MINKVAPMRHPSQSLGIGQSQWLVPARVDAPELLDSGVGSPKDVQQNLADLWRINRYLGGILPLTHVLYPRLQTHSKALICLDIGTGSAQIPLQITQWAQKQGLNLQMAALDFSQRNLKVARTHIKNPSKVILFQGDAHHLPFAANSVDYVISSLFLHHLSPNQVISFLRSAFNVARHGLIMTDLTRGWLPLLAFKIIQPVFAWSYLTRYDGAVSIRRAYTPAELASLAQSAELPSFSVHPSWPWRMTLVAEK